MAEAYLCVRVRPFHAWWDSAQLTSQEPHRLTWDTVICYTACFVPGFRYDTEDSKQPSFGPAYLKFAVLITARDVRQIIGPACTVADAVVCCLRSLPCPKACLVLSAGQSMTHNQAEIADIQARLTNVRDEVVLLTNRLDAVSPPRQAMWSSFCLELAGCTSSDVLKHMCS